MSEPSQNREEALFEAALEKPSAAERGAFLDGACRDDPALRARLDVLLEGHFGAAGFLTQPPERDAPSASVALPGSEDAPARRIGRYKLLERIGEGGMGEVWMAEQEQPVRRRVALKLIKVGMDTRSVVARFEAEGQALALMDHPNIARVFDVGATETGRPYLVMELVRGIKLTEYCDRNRLPTHARLDLFIQVCQAIQHAHQKGIIHRDLKPSNILVTVNDGVPVPKVIDFGIAKAIAQKLTDKTLFTEFQALVGTPAYMSPEQVELSSVDIDTRSDIYSLGVLLYELLVGRTPFNAAEMMREGFDVLWRTIREKEPVKPSTRLRTLPGAELTTAAQRRQTDGVKLTHLLRGDLDWIVMKCLEKDRARRYETANGLAMDIRRYLDNEPIVARRPSPAYRLQKALRRNKLAFTAATLVVLALTVGTGAVILVQHRANRGYRERFYAYQMGRAGAALTAGQFDHLGAALAQCPPEYRHWEWRYLNSQMDRWSQRTVCKIDQPVRKLVISRDGALVALMAGGQNGRIQVRRFPSGERLSTIDVLTSMWAPLVLHPQGDMLAGIPNDDRRVVQVWNPKTGELLKSFQHEDPVACLAFSPDGRLLAAGGGESKVSCWNLATGAPHQPALQISRATALGFAPDGRELAVGTRDDGIHFVELASGRPSARFSVGEDQVRLLAFSPDGKSLVSSQIHPSLQRNFIKLWSRADGSSKDLGLADGGNTQFSPDGRWILSGGAILWDSASGELLGRLRLDELNYGMATAFYPNGGILSGGAGGGVILATPNRPACERLLGHQASLRVLRFSPDGRTLASAGLEHGIRIWDVGAVREPRTYTGHSAGVAALAWSPDGQSVVSGSLDRELHCWDPVTLQLRWTNSMKAIMASEAWWLEFSPDGKQILSSSENGVLGLWDSFTGASLGRIAATNTLAGMDGAAWSPDAARIAVLFKDRVAVWKVQTGQEQWSVPAHADRCVRFSRDGRWLVHGNYDGSVSLRNSGDGRLLRSFDRHQSSVKGVLFSPDGRRLFSGGADGTVRVWDTRTGDELLQLHVTGDRLVWSIDLSPDGRTLAAADSDAVVTLWKTE